ESALVMCALPCAVAGDIHGQFADLVRALNYFNKDGKHGWEQQRFVFLGDYVDRGAQSLEVISYLFILKTLYPKSIFLLRGNHESKAINRVYGFQQELLARFVCQNEGSQLFNALNEAFTHMPLACLVGGKILCMHGGISPHLKSLDDIMKIPKPLVDPVSNPLACDLLWADPMIGLRGFAPNRVRGLSVHFGEDILTATMNALHLQMVVRGHQMMMNGFSFFAGTKLATIFTASAYNAENPNRGAVMEIDGRGRIGFKILTPLSGE
ncbi:hypothetical protein PFISCL1PPCAC_4514, partial [Pristionchus fissidentatus]